MAPTAYPDDLADLDPFELLEDEAARCDRRFAAAEREGGWEAPTGCAGWSVRDLVAHLRHGNRYDAACLDDDLPTLFAEAAENGVSDMHSYNDWGVRLGRGRDPHEVLEEWRTTGAEVRRRLRERGRDGTLTTMVGEYNAGLQALHLAYENAVHADDMDAAVDASEAASRTRWRTRFARWTLLNEKEGGPGLEVRDGRNVAAAGGQTASLSDEELVLAVTGRLDEDRLPPGELREALRALA